MKMKNLLIVLLLSLNSLISFGQSKIQWTYSYNPETKTIEIEANIGEGWHLYSQYVDNEIGPVPTTFVFAENDLIKLVGRTDEPTPIQKYDETFEAMLDFFEGKVVFKQRISSKGNTIIYGTVTYMLCNDVMCLPPTDESFSIEIPN